MIFFFFFEIDKLISIQSIQEVSDLTFPKYCACCKTTFQIAPTYNLGEHAMFSMHLDLMCINMLHKFSDDNSNLLMFDTWTWRIHTSRDLFAWLVLKHFYFRGKLHFCTTKFRDTSNQVIEVLLLSIWSIKWLNQLKLEKRHTELNAVCSCLSCDHTWATKQANLNLIKKTSLKPKDIDFLVFNCSLFSPTLSLLAITMNKYKLPSNIWSFNLSGVGCSAGLLSIDLACNLLQARINSNALVISMEIILPNFYTSNKQVMLLPNSLPHGRCSDTTVKQPPRGLSREVPASPRCAHP